MTWEHPSGNLPDLTITEMVPSPCGGKCLPLNSKGVDSQLCGTKIFLSMLFSHALLGSHFQRFCFRRSGIGTRNKRLNKPLSESNIDEADRPHFGKTFLRSFLLFLQLKNMPETAL